MTASLSQCAISPRRSCLSIATGDIAPPAVCPPILTAIENTHNPSPDLVAEVKAFLRSPSYWTCVRVQTRTTPHLFTRFQELGNAGYSAIICGKPWSYLDGVPSTLPWWLDNVDSESSALIREFHGYVKEWHEALSCGVDAVCMCAMHPAGMPRFPAGAKYVSKGIKRIALGPNSDEGQPDKVAVDHVWTEKGLFKARVVCTPRSEPQKVHWLCTSPFSSKKRSYSGSMASGFDESPQKPIYLGPYIPDSSNGWVALISVISMSRSLQLMELEPIRHRKLQQFVQWLFWGAIIGKWYRILDGGRMMIPWLLAI